MDARLKVFSGPISGQTIQVAHRKLLIGREADCHLRLESDIVSGYHCVVLLDDYTLRIHDLGSKNGTFVNGRRIGTGQTILLHDDTVSIGETNVLIDLTQAASGAQPADSQAQPEVSPTALEATGFFAGDTVEFNAPAVVPPLLPSTPPARASDL